MNGFVEGEPSALMKFMAWLLTKLMTKAERVEFLGFLKAKGFTLSEDQEKEFLEGGEA